MWDIYTFTHRNRFREYKINKEIANLKKRK